MSWPPRDYLAVSRASRSARELNEDAGVGPSPLLLSPAPMFRWGWKMQAFSPSTSSEAKTSFT